MCANGHSTNDNNKRKKGGSFHNKFAYKANLRRRANKKKNNKLADDQFLPAISLAARISGVKLERGADFRRKGCCAWRVKSG